MPQKPCENVNCHWYQYRKLTFGHKFRQNITSFNVSPLVIQIC